MVRVKALTRMSEAGATRLVGDIWETTEERAKQLGNGVVVLKEVKKVPNKMMKKKKSKGY